MNCLSSYSPIPFLHALVLVLIFPTISASYGDGNKTDHQALLHIKSHITQDPYGALTSWNNSLHLCDWTGVTCGKRHKRVIYLRLPLKGLESSLSPHVGNLSFLRELSLAKNNFQGAIPHELGRLSRLRFLDLGRNNFNGVIPASISGCSNLEFISLSFNELVGSIPKEISFLSKKSVGGSIPDTLGHWKNLEEISCDACNLYGNIPKSLYNLSFLTNISLADNRLSGSLPPAIGEMLPHLVIFQLRGNQLTGPLPPSTSNCSSLRYLDISQNMLSGKLTIDLAKLTDIRAISLSSNNIGSKESDEMKFIDSLKNCTRLETLDLGNCKFQGVLPTSIGNISNQLLSLYLDENQLHGNLPRSIGNLVGLELLSVGGNQLTGNIPSTIGNLQRLQLISLNANQLSGPVPNAIGNLSLVIELDLSSNKLQGVIPSRLGNCHNLLALDLSKNKLNGKIPIQVVQLSSLSIYLDLSHNNLFGTLPTEVGELKMLSVLDLSDNNLSDSIPSTLGDCVSLTRLSLKGNLFKGIIPPSLSNLRGLEELDFSYNNLSSQIPKFLEHFPSEYINLSYNDFEGEVEFPIATVFNIMGNRRLCSRVFELRLPECRFKKIKKHSKKFPVFVVVIIVIASIIFTAICLENALCKKRSMVEPSQSSMSNRFLKVSYKQLFKATNGFSEANLIGNGGSSSVYIGIRNEYDDRYVAVKVLHLQNRGAQRSYTRECEAWQNIRQRNLLKIITICSSIDFQGNEFKALVYEFMPKGSLHDWLHSNESTSRINLLQIVNILIDIAYALEYLHNQCVPTVVHGDLKPRNILLDEDMVAHIGDFGLAQLIGTTSYQNISTGITGTIGYVAPEYGLGNELTSSGDVYNFGILLLEVLTGKKPTEDTFNDGLSLHRFASTAFPEHVTDVIDVKILDVFRKDEMFMQNMEANVKEIEECLVSMVKIGVSCSMDSPAQRMDMKMVIHALQQILDRLQNICYFQITCTFFQERNQEMVHVTVTSLLLSHCKSYKL